MLIKLIFRLSIHFHHSTTKFGYHNKYLAMKGFREKSSD